jgi:hypothetical protein
MSCKYIRLLAISYIYKPEVLIAIQEEQLVQYRNALQKVCLLQNTRKQQKVVPPTLYSSSAINENRMEGLARIVCVVRVVRGV